MLRLLSYFYIYGSAYASVASLRGVFDPPSVQKLQTVTDICADLLNKYRDHLSPTIRNLELEDVLKSESDHKNRSSAGCVSRVWYRV